MYTYILLYSWVLGYSEHGEFWTCIFCMMYIYMHVDAHFVVILSHLYAHGCALCFMLILHVDASSLGCWARGCPYFCFYMKWCDVCMTRHVDALMDADVILWFMFYVCKWWCNAVSFGFLFIWMRCYGVTMHDGGVKWCDWYASLGYRSPFGLRHYCRLLGHVWMWWIQTVG